MGYGSYSTAHRAVAATNSGFDTKPKEQIFKERKLVSKLDPRNAQLRESRDSADNPNSVPIILALDVTGSMGNIPFNLIQTGLPTIMGTVIERGITDPHLLLMAIGDHECDSAPLQVAQFEASDSLLDQWLTSIYLEGGGGGNGGESYLLAYYFAANHTSIDSFIKRNEKGFLFTIGDEPTLKVLPNRTIVNLMGSNPYERDVNVSELLEKAQNTFNVFHIHVAETASGSKQSVINGWKEIIGDNLIIVQNHRDIPKTIAETIASFSKKPNTDISEVSNTTTTPISDIKILL